jgi:ADP-heptose:LPS heptosyltransferase
MNHIIYHMPTRPVASVPSHAPPARTLAAEFSSAPRVGQDTAAARLVICRECDQRRVDPKKGEYCAALTACKPCGPNYPLAELCARVENFAKPPFIGCRHPRRAAGRGWLGAPAQVQLSKSRIQSRVRETSEANPKSPALVFTASNKPVDLAGLYHGRSAFLICGGPSFGALDHAQLRQPGILTMGVNNSAKTFRPNLWTFVDGPDHFLRSIFLDPAILKFCPIKQANGRLFNGDAWRYLDTTVGQCPATLFYHRHCGWNSKTFLAEPTICWGNDGAPKTEPGHPPPPPPPGGWGGRSVMLVAIRLLHYLGVRRIFLLGADFKMSETQRYHFEQARAAGSISGNNDTYAKLNKRFAEARPIFEAAGLTILNCNPDSGLTAFPFCDFKSAISDCLAEFGHIDTAAERTAGLYDTKKPGEKLILKAPNFLGDQVVFTGVLRALHKSNPGLLVTGVDGAAELLQNNPHVTRLDSGAPGVKKFIHDACPNFRRHITTGKHFIQAYCAALAEKLGVKIAPDELRGDIHLSGDERNNPPAGLDGKRYWVVVAGAKTGVPIKRWGTENYQAVVDALAGKVHFVQIGDKASWHPPLRGVTNLIGKTSVRELIRLIYHADGVLCPITSAMHMAAAIPPKPGGPDPRPCVVIAGGREPVAYIQYRGHTVLANIGALPCSQRPCGQSNFNPPNGCKRPVNAGGQQIPECMAMIKPADVVAAIIGFPVSAPVVKSPISNLKSPALAPPPRIYGRTTALLKRLPPGPIRGAEVGVNLGQMAAQVLRGHSELHHIMVDRWGPVAADTPCVRTDPKFYTRPDTDWAKFKARAIAATEFAASRRSVIHAPSAEAAAQVPDASLDYVFIDADHSYEGCRDDIAAWLPKVRPGGLLGGHDYGRSAYPREGVKPAVDEAASRLNLKLELDEDLTWWFRLPTAPR